MEILLHSNLAFSQCSTSIYQAFDEPTEFCRYLMSWLYATCEIHTNDACWK